MPFCPHCGGPADSLPVAVIETGESEAVQLARIAKEEAVEVERIRASAHRAELVSAETIAETEADAQVQSAEAVAAVITATNETEAPAEPEPIVIDAPQVTDVQADDDAPPLTADDDHQPHAPSKARGLGFW